MSMAGVISLLSDTLLIGGALFSLIGGVGLLRMPDFYTRVHAASITEVGTGLMLLGLMLKAGLTQDSIKLAILFALSLFANPTATHALARSALLSGLKPRLGKHVSVKEGASSKL